MPTETARIKRILIDRLKERGISSATIPGFIRCLANSLLSEPGASLWQINKRLNYLGWSDFKLDYHTLQLAIACFEAEGLTRIERIQRFLFEGRFKSYENGTHSKIQ